MIRPANSRLSTVPTPCPCTANQPSTMGALPTIDWHVWALVAAAALILFLLLQQTPQRQEVSYKKRQARARYKAELAKLREEYR